MYPFACSLQLCDGTDIGSIGYTGLLHRAEHVSRPVLESVWFEAYPQARSYAVPGVREAHLELPFTDVLMDKPAAEWKDAFDQHLVGFNEIVFSHPVSNSAILTNLVFNYETDPGFNFATRCMLTDGRHL